MLLSDFNTVVCCVRNVMCCVKLDNVRYSIFVHVHSYLCIYVPICVHFHTCIFVYAHTYICIFHTFAYIYICICTYICTHLFICTSIYIYQQVNSRAVLAEVLSKMGVPEEQFAATCVLVDKLEKVCCTVLHCVAVCCGHLRALRNA